MAHAVLFHHALGVTMGITRFAERVRAAGHTIAVPDLYAGRAFASLEEGVAFAESVGPSALLERAYAACSDLEPASVYVGISLGVAAAQTLAATRPGARGAVLVSACLPPDATSPPWPAGVAVRIHAMENDAEFDNGWDLPAARDLVAHAEDGKLVQHRGANHLFMEDSADACDVKATDAVLFDVLDLLGPT